MAKNTAAKLSVSVPADLVREVRSRIGARALSGFVARAMAHELEREQLGALLSEFDAKQGAVPDAVLKKVRLAWHKR